jgi:hypothetical protein
MTKNTIQALSAFPGSIFIKVIPDDPLYNPALRRA